MNIKVKYFAGTVLVDYQKTNAKELLCSFG